MAPQQPISLKKTTGAKLKQFLLLKKQKERSGGASVVQYDNYRSSSWDSATYQKESEALLDPLMGSPTRQNQLKNPYE